MAFLTKKVGAEGEFPLTPLVDVMFNLLIFVIVTAQYSNIQSLKVSLPKAQTGVTLEEAESVVVTLTREEKIFVNNDSVSLDRLKERLSPLAQKEDPPRVLLQADEGSSTGGLVKVMDLVQQSGLKKISIETRK